MGKVLVKKKIEKVDEKIFYPQKTDFGHFFEGSHGPKVDLMGCIIFEGSLRLKVKSFFEWVHLLVL